MSERVVFMGTPDFGVPILTALNDGHEVVGVFTRPDSPAGRGRRPSPSPVKEAAMAIGIPVYERRTMRGEEPARVFADLRPDVAVVAAYAYLLPSTILGVPEHGCLNVHPSLLPRHRGPSPVAGAILAGDQCTGVSIMLMDEGLDTGPVLGQQTMPVCDWHTTGSLTAALADLGAGLLLPTLDRWLRGEARPQPQEERLATFTRRIEASDGILDWSRPARELWRQVRAFNPWPGSYTTWNDKRLKIRSAIPLDLRVAGEPGTVVPTPAGEQTPVAVVTGQGALGLVTLQLEGKREMPAREFLAGQRDFPGAVLPS